MCVVKSCANNRSVIILITVSRIKRNKVASVRFYVSSKLFFLKSNICKLISKLNCSMRCRYIQAILRHYSPARRKSGISRLWPWTIFRWLDSNRVCHLIQDIRNSTQVELRIFSRKHAWSIHVSAEYFYGSCVKSVV